MAAPLVAGLAVIIRQYFQKMWTGLCNKQYSSCTAFTPTGTSVTATDTSRIEEEAG